MGILQGAWDTDETMELIIERSHRAKEMEGKIVFSRDPKELLDKLVKIIDSEKEKHFSTHSL